MNWPHVARAVMHELDRNGRLCHPVECDVYLVTHPWGGLAMDAARWAEGWANWRKGGYAGGLMCGAYCYVKVEA